MELLIGLSVGAVIIGIAILVQAAIRDVQNAPSQTSRALRLDGMPEWPVPTGHSKPRQVRSQSSRKKRVKRAGRVSRPHATGTPIAAATTESSPSGGNDHSWYADDQMYKMVHAISARGTYVNEYSIILGLDDD